MLQGAVLFNGIRFPFALIDQSFDWAKKEQASLVVIYLVSKESESENYPIPSDLDSAETQSSEEDSASDTLNVIGSNVRMLTHRAQTEEIKFQTKVLYDPSGHDLKETLEGYDCIFVSDDIAEPSASAFVSINPEKWLKNLSGKVVRISS